MGADKVKRPRLVPKPVTADIAPGATLGADCTIDAGAHVGDGVILGSGVHVGAHAVLSGHQPGEAAAGAIIRDRVHIGPNATILSGVTVEAGAVVRGGAVVTRSVPPNAIVEGNPASIVGYVDAEPRAVQTSPSNTESVEPTPVNGVTVHELRVVNDLRGNLTVGEFDRQIPFVPLRYFIVFDVPSREVRGEHAHRTCHQFLICVRGRCSVIADDGSRRIEVSLDAPNRGLYLPPMTWGIQYRYTEDAMLLVFASHPYDPDDYIRDYAEYRAAIAQA